MTALVDAARVAEHLGVSRDYVYEHAAELGALRLGSGPRARLRFDLGEVDSRLTSCSRSRGSEAAGSGTVARSRRRRRSAGLGTNVPLLPIKDRLEVA
jgi:hypothetical protein